VSFVGTQALADELGKDAAGVMVTQVVPSPYNLGQRLAREFLEAVRKAGGGAPAANFSSMEGYLAAKVLTEGLRKALGQADARRPRRGPGEHGTASRSAASNVSFSAKNHVASKFVELSMLTGDGGCGPETLFLLIRR
jgi:branched-chain amino acid transport system substrate-binding protein